MSRGDYQNVLTYLLTYFMHSACCSVLHYLVFYCGMSVLLTKNDDDVCCVQLRGATTSSKLGVQFLGLGYYYPSTENKLDRSTQFGAVGYIITLYS